jgi:hypothetical protein
MKMHIKGLLKFVSAVAVVASCQLVSAQTTDTQRFTVTVPSTLSITAPSDRVQAHDTTNNNQVFAPGTNLANHWAVSCNSNAGATVLLTTSTPFTNGTHEQDARLDLAVSSTDNTSGATPTAIWSVTQPSGQTNYLAGTAAGDTASVIAQSSRPGKATLGLTVTFVMDNAYSTLSQGNYVIDVVGTIAAN